MCLPSLQAEPVDLADVAHAPLWFAHVDMGRLKVAEGAKSVDCSGAVQHVVKLQKLVKQSLGIELEDIRGITIFGATSSGKETCFLLKGNLTKVSMGDVVDTYSIDTGQRKQTYTLHGGLQWLGEEWYLSRLETGEVAGSNSRVALKSLLAKRKVQNLAADDRWSIDAETKLSMAAASVVVAFNIEAIQGELKLESSLSNLIKTVSLVVIQNASGAVTTKFTLQAKDSGAMKVITPEIQLLITLLQAYEEGEKVKGQHVDCWRRAQVKVSESSLSIGMEGTSDEMVQSLQKLEKLLPKQAK